MENAYVRRLEQLRNQKVEDNKRRVLPRAVQRDVPEQQGGPAMGPGNPGAAEEEEVMANMDNMFGMSVQKFEGEDSRFQEFMKQYTQMANGLRQQVDQGYMPMPIAQQRLEQYLNDSRGYFSQNAASPMDNPQVAQAIDGLMGQAMQGGLPEQQAANPPAQPAQAMVPQEPRGGM